MFTRLFVFAMALSLLTTQSFAVTNNGLQVAFDELAYSMEVEGASMNADARVAASNAFAQRVAALQEQGMSNSELVKFAQSQIKNKKVAAEVAAAYDLIQTEKLSQEEVRDLLNDMSSKMYAQGASWNGDATTYLAIGAVIVIVIALALMPADKCANEAYARGNIEQCQNSSYNGAYYNI